MLIELLVFLSGLLAYYYWSFQKKCQHWQQLGVKTPDHNLFPFGNNPAVEITSLLGWRNNGEILFNGNEKFYWPHSELNDAY